MADYKQLCVELLDSAEELDDLIEEIRLGDYMLDSFTLQPMRAVLARARAELAKPEPEVPTDKELLHVFYTACLSEGGMADEIHLRGLRAVLRAVADQVVPDEGDRWTRDLRGDAWIRWEERKLLRRDLLAIAGELKAQ